MLASNLKTALRFFWRQKSYAFINVFGLTIGLACSFFILLWVQDELRYDRFHEQGDQLHRVMRNASFSNGQIFTWSAIPKPLAETLETD
jgi:putative ABC transport system permease protein